MSKSSWKQKAVNGSNPKDMESKYPLFQVFLDGIGLGRLGPLTSLMLVGPSSKESAQYSPKALKTFLALSE